jgi:hypothetical protein
VIQVLHLLLIIHHLAIILTLHPRALHHLHLASLTPVIAALHHHAVLIQVIHHMTANATANVIPN